MTWRTSPIRPASMARRISAKVLSKRRLKASITRPPTRSTSAAALSLLAMSRSIGFSQRTALPSSTAFRRKPTWVSVGVPITTASTSDRATAAIGSVIASVPSAFASGSTASAKGSAKATSFAFGFAATLAAWILPMRPAPRTAIPTIGVSSFIPSRRRIAPRSRVGSVRGQADGAELLHRGVERALRGDLERQVAMVRRDQLRAVVAAVADVEDRLELARDVDRTFAAEAAVVRGVVEERAHHLRSCVVKLDGQQQLARELADVLRGDAAALDVPGVDEQPTVRRPEPVEERQPAINAVDAGERQELDNDVDAQGRRALTDRGEGAAHGGQVGLALLKDAAPELDLLDPQLGADLQHPVVHRLGGAALLAVQVPVQQELKLDVADAVVGEDAPHGRQAVPGDRSLHVVDHEAHAAPADPPRYLGAILQGEGADLARCARIDGAADRPVGRAEVDVFGLHLDSLGDAVWGRPPSFRWPTASCVVSRPVGRA